MAKSDNNLTAVFTDIANAIRNKTGNTATMTPRDFADGVMAIDISSEGGANLMRQKVVELYQGTETTIDLRDFPEVTTLRNGIGNTSTALTTFYAGNVEIIPPAAFNNCDSLSTVVFGTTIRTIGLNAFHSCINVNNMIIPHTSQINSIGSQAFYHFGSSRSGGEWFIWPLMNCVFTTIPDACWEYNKYSTFLLPSTVKTISSLAFAYGSNITVYLNSFPKITNDNEFVPFKNTSNLNIVVNYMLDETTLKGMPGWASYAANIVSGITGVASGDTLPPYTSDTGVAVTWYSDSAHTTAVTTSVSASDIYYADKGTTRVVWHVTQFLADASIAISDGNTNYGDFIPVGTTVTITPSATDALKDQLFLFMVNGVDYTSEGAATITVDQDLSIRCMYYDGVNSPFLPTLADNDWSMIKLASQIGAVPATWKAGDTKTYNYNGRTYTARLLDKTGAIGLTRASDGKPAYLYFETTEQLDNDLAKFHSSSSNNVINSSLIQDLNSGTRWGYFENDLRSALEDVNVVVAKQGNVAYSAPIPLKVWLPRFRDVSTTSKYCRSDEWDAIGQTTTYYQEHDTNSDRMKAYNGTLGSQRYWCLSPYSGGSNRVCFVKDVGSMYADYADYKSGVVPCFAL